jgi:site-specific DNA-methyltransferase (adenine-specific)
MIIWGNCVEEMKFLADAEVDAIVTDPPYGLAFMNKHWDYDVPGVEVWREALRVLKPGGHLLSFGGTRTYHRMACAIEDAGFEIRDQIQWLYGSGFPKSLDVSKAMDKAAGAEREVVGIKEAPGGFNRGVLANTNFGRAHQDDNGAITAPATDLAKQWQGWGTALKPANEPIVLARKPLIGTVAKNVEKYGTGALNIEASRVAGKLDADPNRFKKTDGGAFFVKFDIGPTVRAEGRWPANIILDEQAAEALDEQSIAGGIHSAGKGRSKKDNFDKSKSMFGIGHAGGSSPRYDDGENPGASRFFYVAKASKSERNAGLDSADLVWEFEVWQRQDLNSLTENINQLARAISDAQLTAAKQWNIDGSGPTSTDRYPPALIFTIETATKLITDLRTLSASQSSIINASILDAIRTIEASGLSLAESAAFTSPLKLNTTSAEMASALGAVHALLQTLSKLRSFAKSQNFHSTVKPIALMEYLIRLVTPPGGVVLDPFMGSGSTGCAAVKLGFKFIGIEQDEEYVGIARKRIAYWKTG